MTRKGKAFWIGFLVPIITLCVWASPIVSRPLGLLWGWDALVLSGPAFVVGGLLALIAYFCTSGPPMGRRGKAAWIGFFVPVVPGSGIMLYAFFYCALSGGYFQGMGTYYAMLYFEGPSILLGLLIALIAASRTRNKPGPPKCGKCGYSLVGLTSDKCPECGHTVSSTAAS